MDHCKGAFMRKILRYTLFFPMVLILVIFELTLYIVGGNKIHREIASDILFDREET